MSRTTLSVACVFLLSTLGACEKNESKPAPDVRLRVFTQAGEITNEKVKQRFIEQSPYPFTVSSEIGPNDFLRFVAPDSVIFGLNGVRLAVVQTGTQHLLYGPLAPQDPNLSTEVRALLKYTSPVVPLPPATGYGFLTKNVWVGYGDRSTMRMPLLHYRIRQSFGGGSYNDLAGATFNEFNEAAIRTIRPGDTLAVQESSITVPVR
ncbi:hypothetical protein [Hymenobacter elongatus]|uniref:Uncharacterized protein n=1 Tax=Hymenobacter elongatus TaxID=877208 RepID=A0A4Z0PJA2_9BACT|nr:hypothetical protein [Hymenobacter elongatus]TGE14136.1 hypothetical protein E5J99_17500 [Hymenobacter elongatus]